MSLPDNYIDNALASDETVLAIHGSEGEVLGAASFTVHGSYVHLSRLGSRRRGVGTRLMKHVIAIAEGKPITLLSENDAVAFYQKFGFRITQAGLAASEMWRT